MNYCCDNFREGVDEGVWFYSVYSGKYELDGYDVKGDYPINYCPNCGKKVEVESEGA